MSDSEKTHVLVQDCIISRFGKVEAGFAISESDVDSVTWSYLNRNNMVKSIASIISDADANDVTEANAKVTTEKTPEEMIETVKSIIGDGKAQMKTIVQKSGISEDVIAPLLTEANGFTKNQQGWFSKIIIQPTTSGTAESSDTASKTE